MENLKFSELNLSKPMEKALDAMGFEEATPIQTMSIPLLLEGKDVIGQAQTGTGKTCAFGIPAVEMIDPDIKGTQVLVLCPTRELAIQVSEEIRSLCKYKHGIKSLAIYGGQAMDRQIMSLKGKPQIIIGTPGRVMDHMRRRTIKLENLKMLVLDEADEMLNMGFREDIDTICEAIPEERHTMLFSATMPSGILEIAKLYMKDPTHVKTVQKEVTINTIEQYYIEVRESSKLELLSRLMDAKNYKLGIVFCNTKWKVDELCNSLQARGYSAEALHGDMKQRERDRVMNKFRKGQVDLLVATDVAARGIDVSDIDVVFNYDIPSDSEYYVHRIGRTGRAGKTGVSYSFVFGKDIYKLKDIERYTKSKINRAKPPTISSIEASRIQTAKDEILSVLEDGSFSKYTESIEELLDGLEEYTTLDIASALFKLKFSDLDARTYEYSELDNDFTLNKRNKFKDLLKDKGVFRSEEGKKKKSLRNKERSKNNENKRDNRKKSDKSLQKKARKNVANNDENSTENEAKKKSDKKAEKKSSKKSEVKSSKKAEKKSSKKAEKKNSKKAEKKGAKSTEKKSSRSKSKLKDADALEI